MHQASIADLTSIGGPAARQLGRVPGRIAIDNEGAVSPGPARGVDGMPDWSRAAQSSIWAAAATIAVVAGRRRPRRFSVPSEGASSRADRRCDTVE